MDSKLNTVLKAAISACVPARMHPRRLSADYMSRLILNRRILSGPFVGMKYLPEACGSVLPAKILGTYELELNSELCNIIAVKPRTIIDIGAAEGYYAVGLAWRLPSARVIAFELNEHGRILMGELADVNGVSSRLDIRGLCTAETFAVTLIESTPQLVIIDTEGAELELLSPKNVELLAKSMVIVELHPWVEPEVREILTGRFSCSHVVKLFETSVRTPKDLPVSIFVKIMLGRWLAQAASELRPCPMEWLVLYPKCE